MFGFANALYCKEENAFSTFVRLQGNSMCHGEKHGMSLCFDWLLSRGERNLFKSGVLKGPKREMAYNGIL